MKLRSAFSPVDIATESGPEVGQHPVVLRTPSGCPTPGGLKRIEPFQPPDPEVPEKKTRRKFTAAYKLRILQEADQCDQPGSIGALLRHEGLYSSHLTTWRRQRDQGALQGLNPKKRGRKAKPEHPWRLVILGKKKGRLNWQLISFLPQLAAMIDGMLESARESYGPFPQISVHEDYTIKRVSEVTGQQIENAWLYDTQLDKWSKYGPKTVQLPFTAICV